ncbi:MAG: alpha-glucan family phosphorylase [Porphyromonadaceae bacterium]|nr:MAG: alpha-glucan family phosphorylase [Porphyromonadaceae bacterium]
MTENGNQNSPEVLFEVSWEVCNKVGGIYTVLTSKCEELLKRFGEHYLFIGPDIWREDHDNPDFIEDNTLFLGWKEHAFAAGLRFRTGRWNIPGKPQVIMIDFTPLIAKKDEIFSKAWEDYRLDSISGGWDYIEASLFGYAAGMLIKSFAAYYRFHQVIAQFHEWMTAMGILYIEKQSPYIGTVFTTHATTVGRSIAGNGLPLYENLSEYSGDETAARLNVTAKHSLEKLAAINCDQFTTVSEITAEECTQLIGRRPDIITPNGFNPDLVPDTETLKDQRLVVRQAIRKIAQAIFGYEISEDFLAIGTSGRYEFRNKGIDVFIKSLARLNEEKDLTKEIIALILIPANNYGPRRSVGQRLNGELIEISGSMHLTHNLHDVDSDPIIRLLNETGLDNDQKKKVKVIFIPCYLDGQDGIVNLTYYQILAGLDYTVFPSYYEPWGYTPLESIAFGVPTLTTDQAGFGLWMSAFKTEKLNLPVAVAPRKGKSDDSLIEWILEAILSFSQLSENQRKENFDLSILLSKKALWENLVSFYYLAYSYALSEVVFEDRPEPEFAEETYAPVTVDVLEANEPLWKRVLVESLFPEKLGGLEEISKNLWWTWNYEAENLFRSIDPVIWELVEHNPITLMRQIPLNRLMELEQDENFNRSYKEVYAKFQDYLKQVNPSPGPMIAYFSMEFGFHASLKIYSGGLGILAGDYLKEASDRNVPIIGFGLLYRYGYFRQVLTINGDQVSEDVMEQFSDLPVEPVFDEEGQWFQIPIGLPGRLIHVRLWKAMVGRINLYLLDTDFDANQPADRTITYHLYGGDEENRLKQEMVLGLGGIRMLNKLGISPNVYHCNEGHAAFIGIERISRLMDIKKFTFDESLEVVRGSTLFTTHTPVPAGHDTFNENMIRTYMGKYSERFSISWEDFIGLGRIEKGNSLERFSMSYLAARLSQEINAVSNLHGIVTRKMFEKVWKGYFADELHVGFVTNGVHYQTWAAEAWQKLYLEVFGEKFLDNQSTITFWSKIHTVPDERIWTIRQNLRKILIDYIRYRLEKVSIKRHEPPKQIIEIQQRLNEKSLTIGFARRFATYKRAHLIFQDLDRLNQIVNNPECPVQFIFAGKAHPRDKAGQDLIKYIVEISRRPEFRGRIVFLENYDMTVARKLVQGVDIWLNTPTRPLEASGTSGMKATMNGVMNFSVLDGWWCEGYRPNAGWALPEERVYDDQNFQDELDAATIYDLLEDEIVPLFYKVNEHGVPEDWIKHIKNTIAQIAPMFTTRRMIDDYYDRFYKILGNRSSDMRANNYHLAREITRWKKKVARWWDKIEIPEVNYSKDLSKPLRMGEEYTAEVVLKLNGLSADDIGVELVVVSVLPDGKHDFVFRQEFAKVEKLNGHTRYRIGTIPTQPGIFNYGIRVFPKSGLVPHRQDFSLVRWI